MCVCSDEFYTYIKHGLIRTHTKCGDMTGSDGLSVVLGDKVIAADVVILATGTHAATLTQGTCSQLKFLRRYLREEDMPLNCYHSLFLPHFPRACFVGFAHGFASIPRVATMQAAYVCRVLSGKVKLPSPSAMQAAIRKAMANDSHGSSMNLTSAVYVSEIRKAAGLSSLGDPIGSVIKKTVCGLAVCGVAAKLSGVRSDLCVGVLVGVASLLVYRKLVLSAASQEADRKRQEEAAKTKQNQAYEIMNGTLDGTDETAKKEGKGKEKVADDEVETVKQSYTNWAATYDSAMDVLGWRALGLSFCLSCMFRDPNVSCRQGWRSNFNVDVETCEPRALPPVSELSCIMTPISLITPSCRIGSCSTCSVVSTCGCSLRE